MTDTAGDIIAALDACGARLELQDECLMLHTGSQSVPTELLTRLRALKSELVEYLALTPEPPPQEELPPPDLKAASSFHDDPPGFAEHEEPYSDAANDPIVPEIPSSQVVRLGNGQLQWVFPATPMSDVSVLPLMVRARRHGAVLVRDGSNLVIYSWRELHPELKVALERHAGAILERLSREHNDRIAAFWRDGSGPVTQVWLDTTVPAVQDDEPTAKESVSGTSRSSRAAGLAPSPVPYEVLGDVSPGERCTLCGSGRDVKRIRHGGQIHLWHRSCADRHLETIAHRPPK